MSLPFYRPAHPPGPNPREPILRVRKGKSVFVTVLSTVWWAVQTHWDTQKERSFPCTGPGDACEHCRRQMPARWRAYVHVLHTEGRCTFDVFLELTPGLAHEIEAQLGQVDDLRGQRWQITRGNADNARMQLSVQAHHTAMKGGELPPEKCPEKDLMRLWGLLPHKRNGKP